MTRSAEPTCTVVVPNLHSAIVGQTIASVLGQTLPKERFHVVVVGQDRYGIVRSFPQVDFVETSTPVSPSVARNLGASRSSAEVVAFIDSDCIAAADWLEILESRFRDQGVQVVGGGVSIPRASYFSMADNLALFHEFLASSPGGQRTHLPGLNLAVRLSTFRESGGFDETYPNASGEDTEFTVRLREHGHELVFEPRAVVVHHSRRHRLSELIARGLLQGRFSIKVDARYLRSRESLPRFLHHKGVLLLLSPLLGLAATCRIYAKNRSTWRYWRLFPAVAVSRVAWGLGAASALH